MDAWVVRAGKGGAYAHEWLADNYIAIYWDFGRADIASLSKDELKELYPHYYPNSTAQEISSNVSMVAHFAHDLCEGTTIIMPDLSEGVYHLGQITGPCIFDPNDHHNHEGAYRYSVTWQKDAPSYYLSIPTIYSLNRPSTIFKVNEDIYAELVKASENKDIENTFDDGTYIQIFEAMDEQSLILIRKRIMDLNSDKMEDLVAGLLRAMGYQTETTSRSKDGGFDVIATLEEPGDELGFEPPRMLVEVKRKTNKVDVKTVRAFIGILDNADRGLFVSTGGFNQDAQTTAEQAHHPVKLLDMNGFIQLYTKYYENTDEDTRAILPLKRIYWPE